MIKRAGLQKQVQAALRRSRVVALIGPRQCGKTTLARGFIAADWPSSDFGATRLDAMLPAFLQSSPGFRLRTAPVSTELRRGKSPRQVNRTGDRVKFPTSLKLRWTGRHAVS